MKDNLIINGIEYTPVQKTKDPEPRVYWISKLPGVHVLYDHEPKNNADRFVECPVGSVVISYRDLLYAWDYSADKFGDAPNFLKMCKILKVLK